MGGPAGACYSAGMKGFIAVAVAAVVAGSVVLYADVAAPSKASLSAALVDAEHRALRKEAFVEVTVKGLKLVDPSDGGRPKAGEGHLLYQVDSGPVFATAATRMAFLELAPGKRVIKVTLAANDHLPLGPARLLETTIP